METGQPTKNGWSNILIYQAWGREGGGLTQKHLLRQENVFTVDHIRDTTQNSELSL